MSSADLTDRRKCGRCRKVKPVSEFYRCRADRCSECCRRMNRESYRRHLAARKAGQRRWRVANAEYRAEQLAAWKRDHPEQVRASKARCHRRAVERRQALRDPLRAALRAILSAEKPWLYPGGGER